MTGWIGRGVAAVGLAAAASVAAQTMPGMPAPPENVVHLSAQAAAEVPRDRLTVVRSTPREGPEAAAVQGQLKQALETALEQARAAAKNARPGELEVRTGNFSLMPRHTPKGAINLWSGRAELVLEGRDTAAIAALAGRIQTMSVLRVAHGLTREAREQAEAGVVAEAVARYRAKAAEAARLFGFTGYVLREVHLGTSDVHEVVPMAMARMSPGAAMDASPLPTEGGLETVRVTVNGSVQLTR